MGKLFSSTLIYAIGYLVSRLQTFLLLPFLTRYLGPAEFGLLETLNAAGILVMMFTVFNIDSGLTAHFHDQTSQEKKNELIRGCFSLIALSSLVILVPITFFSQPLSLLVTSMVNTDKLFLIAAVASIFAGYIHFWLVTIRMLERPWLYTLVVSIQTLIYFLLSIWFLNIFESKVQAVLMAQLIGNISATIITLVMNSALIPRNLLDIKIWHKEVLLVALPLFPFSIASWALNLFDRGFLAHSRGLSDTGVYPLASKIAQMASLIFSPFQMAWLPRSLQSLKNQTAQNIFTLTARQFLLISGLGLIVLTALAPLLMDLIAPSSYQSANRWVGPLIFCNMLLILYTFASSRFLFNKKSKYSTYSFLWGAGINVLLNLTLTPRYGITGAVIANVVGYTLMFISALIYAHRIHPINFSFLRKLLLLVFLLGIAILPHFIDLTELLSQTTFMTIGAIAYLSIYLLIFGKPRWQV